MREITFTESICARSVIRASVYEPFLEANGHGNFLNVSYSAILNQLGWRRRLEKIHTQAARLFPKAERSWKELASCMSSDALLMNVFCRPRVIQCSGAN